MNVATRLANGDEDNAQADSTDRHFSVVFSPGFCFCRQK